MGWGRSVPYGNKEQTMKNYKGDNGAGYHEVRYG